MKQDQFKVCFITTTPDGGIEAIWYKGDAATFSYFSPADVQNTLEKAGIIAEVDIHDCYFRRECSLVSRVMDSIVHERVNYSAYLETLVSRASEALCELLLSSKYQII